VRRHCAPEFPFLVAISMNNRRWITLAIAASALFLICVDITVLFVALPSLTRDLGAGNTAKLWIINVYSLVVAGLLPGLGTLGDRYGHRRLFIAGLALFGCTSLAAAYSTSPALLIAARAFQGIAGATMMPATLAIIRGAFSDQHERALAIGLWAGIASAGLALGPLIGGLLLEYFWWGSVFLINVPVVLVALIFTLWLVPSDAPTSGHTSWDLIGSLQIMVGLFGLVFAIKEIAQPVFSAVAFAAALAVVIAFTTLYIRRQNRRPTPLLDFTLFRLPDFSSAVAAAIIGTAGIVGFDLILVQHLQLVQERSPLQAALVLLPISIGALLASPITGRIQRWLAPSTLTAAGLLLSAACALLLVRYPVSMNSNLLLQIALLLGIGAGNGMSTTCASTVIMGSAPPSRAGMAASIEEVGFELGAALGVAIFGSMMTLAYATSLVLPALPIATPDIAQASLDEALLLADQLLEGGAALRAAARAAFDQALTVVLVGVAALWACTAVIILRTRNKPSDGIKV
jgi:MFS transporter, DHA2 family, multidrug resistance protein